MGSTGQTTKLHWLWVYAIYVKVPYRGKGQQVPGDKLLNYTLYLQQPWKKSGGPQVKLQNYTDFECMPYQFVIFIREKGH